MIFNQKISRQIKAGAFAFPLLDMIPEWRLWDWDPNGCIFPNQGYVQVSYWLNHVFFLGGDPVILRTGLGVASALVSAGALGQRRRLVKEPMQLGLDWYIPLAHGKEWYPRAPSLAPTPWLEKNHMHLDLHLGKTQAFWLFGLVVYGVRVSMWQAQPPTTTFPPAL